MRFESYKPLLIQNGFRASSVEAGGPKRPRRLRCSTQGASFSTWTSQLRLPFLWLCRAVCSDCGWPLCPLGSVGNEGALRGPEEPCVHGPAESKKSHTVRCQGTENEASQFTSTAPTGSPHSNPSSARLWASWWLTFQVCLRIP